MKSQFLSARGQFCVSAAFLVVGILRYFTGDGGTIACTGFALLFLIFGLRAKAEEKSGGKKHVRQ